MQSELTAIEAEAASIGGASKEAMAEYRRLRQVRSQLQAAAPEHSLESAEEGWGCRVRVLGVYRPLCQVHTRMPIN